MNNFPNLLIIGVFKAGTTSLFHYLIQHPDICGAQKKETHFFSPLVFNNGEIPDLDEYAKFFCTCKNEKYCIEATPSYFYGGKKLIPIFKNNFSTKHKLIVILRNPVDRFISYYQFLKSNSSIKDDEDFEVFLTKCLEAGFKNSEFKIDIYSNAIKEGFYSFYLKEWFNNYEKKNLLVCFFDELNNPAKLMKRISAWLGIEEKFYEDFLFTVENKTRTPRWKQIHKYLVKLNSKHEGFFRQNPRIKNTLRKFYFSLNYDNSEKVISDKSILKLTEVYREPNIELKEMLQSVEIEILPRWLNL